MTTISPRHLIRRWWGTIRAQPPTRSELDWVRTNLLPQEWTLWASMDWRDQSHSYQVARRFVEPMHGESPPSRAAIAAALLHDVGKVASDLTTFERVLATIIGGRSARFRAYFDHESIGLDMCRRAGSDPVTLALLAGEGDDATRRRLSRADDL